MSDDLVKRLRNKYASPQDAIEAADRIEQLDASSEGWKEIADEYFDAICERNTRIEKLKAALRDVISVTIDSVALAIAVEALEGKDDAD